MEEEIDGVEAFEELTEVWNKRLFDKDEEIEILMSYKNGYRFLYNLFCDTMSEDQHNTLEDILNGEEK